MTVLVTGGAGRIGRHVVDRLVARGREVRAMVQPGSVDRARLEGRTDITIVDASLDDPVSMRPAVDGVDAVIHLAAALSSRGSTDQQFVDWNLKGTFSLLAALRDTGRPVERFVYASSDAVYWRGLTVPPRYLPIDEEHPTEPGSVYGWTKLAAEELCRMAQRAWGIPFSIVRPSATADASELVEPDGVFARRMRMQAAIRAIETASDPGPADRELLAVLRAVDDGRDRLFAVADMDGRTARTTLNDARDGAEGFCLALEHPDAAGNVFNIGPDDGYDEVELIEHLGDRLGLPRVVVRSSQVRPSWVVSSARAQRVLGYRPSGSVFTMVDEALAGQGVTA